MVDTNYTVDKLLAFLREAPEQGVLHSAAARSRVNAIDQWSSVLSPEERADIRLIDVARLAGRLHTLEGSTLRRARWALGRSRVVGEEGWWRSIAPQATVGTVSTARLEFLSVHDPGGE